MHRASCVATGKQQTATVTESQREAAGERERRIGVADHGPSIPRDDAWFTASLCVCSRSSEQRREQ